MPVPFLSLLTTLLRNVQILVVNCFIKFVELLGLLPSIEYIISSNKNPVAEKNRKIERILRKFPNDRINSFDWDTGDETEAAEEILVDNSINNLDLSKNLARSMRQIRGYQKLYLEVESRRSEAYDSSNEKHEMELLQLWKLLMPNVELEARQTHQWEEIGFQGKDPATDFRGMGILGLDQLVFFAQYDVHNCQRIFSLSLHPRYGFPFAICGIAISRLVRDLLCSEMLKNHFYNAFRDSPTMDSFHQVYSRVFTLFAEFWELSDPSTIMEFNQIKNKFSCAIERYLEQSNANLLNVNLEKILDASEY